MPFKLPSDIGDLPPEFYANIQRHRPESRNENLQKPNAWDIHACRKYEIWSLAPDFDPHAYDWTTWWWPLPERLERLARSMKGSARNKPPNNEPKYVY